MLPDASTLSTLILLWHVNCLTVLINCCGDILSCSISSGPSGLNGRIHNPVEASRCPLHTVFSSYCTMHSYLVKFTNNHPTRRKYIRDVPPKSVEKRRDIPTTNVGDISIIPTENDIPTENNKEQINLTRMKSTIKPTQQSIQARTRAWNAIMHTDWVQQ